MTVTVIWDDDDKTIQRFIYDGMWTWDELYGALSKGHQMLDTVDYPVDSIVDMSGTNFIPSGAMLHLKRVFSIGSAHPNYSGITVFLEAEGFIRAVHMMVRDVYPESAQNIDFIFASSLEEAHNIIRSLRPRT